MFHTYKWGFTTSFCGPAIWYTLQLCLLAQWKQPTLAMGQRVLSALVNGTMINWDWTSNNLGFNRQETELTLAWMIYVDKMVSVWSDMRIKQVYWSYGFSHGVWWVHHGFTVSYRYITYWTHNWLCVVFHHPRMGANKFEPYNLSLDRPKNQDGTPRVRGRNWIPRDMEMYRKIPFDNNSHRQKRNIDPEHRPMFHTPQQPGHSQSVCQNLFTRASSASSALVIKSCAQHVSRADVSGTLNDFGGGLTMKNSIWLWFHHQKMIIYIYVYI